ncbi:Transcriptional adapter ada2 [Malassezia sp. CBS 17886]|nr:Transcriptional adapter ada2 [Malassezia sp. CBS 17886]
MTVSHRKPRPTQPNQDRTGEYGRRTVLMAAAEPGLRYHCDVCGADITLTVRIRCAGGCEDFDLCGTCFCTGAEVGTHKAWHDYRVIEQHAEPIYCPDWGADEELLLIDGCQVYGLGNWADIANHIGNRTKEDVERHFIEVYVEGRNGMPSGDERARAAVAACRREQPPSDAPPVARGEERLPVVGPDADFVCGTLADEFQKQRRERIEALCAAQAAFVPPKPNAKPLTSAPATHSELMGFMPGRLEFEHEYEQDAEHLVSDMEFGRVYAFGGDAIPRGNEQGERNTVGGPVVSARGAPKSETDTKAAVNDAAENEDDTFSDALASPTQTHDVTMADSSTGGVQKPSDGANTSSREATGDAASTKPHAEDASTEGAEEGAPDWDEDPSDLDLKLTVLQMYDEQLDRRWRKKYFLFDRNLVDYRRNTAAERRRPKEERDLLARIRHFASMQTAEDFEALYQNLCYEEALKRVVRQLQHYRRMGISTFAEAARFDKEAAERATRQLEAADASYAGVPGAHATPGRGRNRDRSTSEMDDRNGDAPFSYAEAPSLHLLTAPEQQLASTLHILPQAFLMLKAQFLADVYAGDKAFTLERMQRLCHISPKKLAWLYDFFVQQGYLGAVAKAGGQSILAGPACA